MLCFSCWVGQCKKLLELQYVTVFNSCIRAWWGRQGSNWLSCGINCELEALPLWTWLWRCGSRGCDPPYRPCFHTKMWIQASIERLGWATYYELWARQWKSVVGRPIFLHIPPLSANRLTRSDVAGCAARDSRVQGGAPDQSSILRERVFASSKIRILGATIDVKIRRHRKQKL